MVSLVEANEPDAIDYESNLNKGETSCVVNEIYTNSEAALTIGGLQYKQYFQRF